MVRFELEFSQINIMYRPPAPPVMRAVLCFLLVWLRGRDRLERMCNADYLFVVRGCRWTAIISTSILFGFALVLPSPFDSVSILAGSVWGMACLMKVGYILAIENRRRFSK